MKSHLDEVIKFNRKLGLILFLGLVVPLLILLWVGARFFIYDICTAKVKDSVPKDQLYVLNKPTREELDNQPNEIGPNSQVTTFYREVLKCKRDAKSRFYLWY